MQTHSLWYVAAMPCASSLEINWDAVSKTIRPVSAGNATASAEIHLDIRLLPLLSRDEMVEMLKQALESGGWRRNADGTCERDVGTVRATLSADGNEITLSLAKEQQALGRTEAEAERVKQALQSKLETELLREMERAEPEVRAELQKALNETYRRALETRARQLGEIESLQERGDQAGSYEVTIVVKG